jgi:WD40 repeat protein
MYTPFQFEAHSSYVLGLLFTPDNQTLISASMDNMVKVWTVLDWNLLRQFKGHANSVNGISLSPDGKTLATGSSDQTVKLWSFEDGKLLHNIQDRKKVVSAVEFSPDGKWIGAVSYGGRAMIWDLHGEPVAGIKVSNKNLTSLAFSLDSKTLATSGLGDEITLWSLPSGEKIKTLSGHKVAVVSLTFIHHGRYLVSLEYEGSIKFWDTNTWEDTRTISVDKDRIRGLAFSPDEKTIALSMESKVQLRSVDDWALQAELPVSTKVVNGMAFSPDGHWFAAGAADRKIRIWEGLLA